MNILLSYPRSGNTWLRYCIEFLSNKSTIGYNNGAIFDKQSIMSLTDVGIKQKSDIIVLKKHFFDDDCDNADKIILLIRDPKECIVKHLKSGGLKPTYKNFNNEFEHYMTLINKTINKDNLIVYYDNLIEKPEDTLKEIMKYLKIKNNKLNEFIKDIDTHILRGYEVYNKDGKIESLGNLNYHYKDIDSDLIDKINLLIKSKDEYKILEKYV